MTPIKIHWKYLISGLIATIAIRSLDGHTPLISKALMVLAACATIGSAAYLAYKKIKAHAVSERAEIIFSTMLGWCVAIIVLTQ